MPNKDRKKRSTRVARQKARAELEAQHKASGYVPPAEGEASGKGSKKSDASSKKSGSSKAIKKADKKKKGNRVTNYFKQVRVEMHKVVWPSRKELRNWSVAVILMLVVFGVCVWLVDTGFVALLVSYMGLRG